MEVRFEQMSLQSEWIHQDNLHIAYDCQVLNISLLAGEDRKSTRMQQKNIRLWQGGGKIAMKWDREITTIVIRSCLLDK